MYYNWLNRVQQGTNSLTETKVSLVYRDNVKPPQRAMFERGVFIGHRVAADVAAAAAAAAVDGV